MLHKITPLNVLNATIILLFVALVVVLPSWHFMTPFTIWFMDGQRILELLLLSLVLMGGVSVKKSHSNNSIPILFNPKIRYALFILLALAIVSSVLAISPRHALIEVSTFAALCYLALYVAYLFCEHEAHFIKYFICALWASMLLFMITFYVVYAAAAVNRIPLIWPQPFIGFTNIRHFNQYQLWGLGLISLPLLYIEFKKHTRIFLQLVLAAWWAMLFYSASRGVLLAWGFGLVMTVAVYRKLAWPLVKLQLVQITAGFLAYYFLFKLLPAFLKLQLVTGTVMRETANDRLALWLQAINLVKESPLFGVGPMHFAWNYQISAHPHNSVLQVAAEFGLPAILIILAVAAYGIYCWINRFSAHNISTQSIKHKQLAVVLFFTIMASAAYSLVDGVIVMPISQVLMFTIFGLMIGHYCNRETKTTIDTSLQRSRFRPIFAVVVLLAMIWSTLPEIIRGLSGHEKGFSVGYTAAGPRFWREVK
ncbi:MAG: O-antigen ligase family protein [Pseudomonadota bacterium]